VQSASRTLCCAGLLLLQRLTKKPTGWRDTTVSKGNIYNARCMAFSREVVQPVGETNTMAVGWSTGTTHFTGYTHCMEGRPLKWTVACGEPQAREEDVAAMRTALDKARRRGGGASRPIGGGVERKATLRYLVVQGL